MLKRLFATIFSMIAMISLTQMTQADECVGYENATPGLYGLCDAFCNALDCNGTPADQAKCDVIASKYEKKMKDGDLPLPGTVVEEITTEAANEDTPAAEDACVTIKDDLGAVPGAYGLCVAGCGALECIVGDTRPQCQSINARFTVKTGDDLPCMAPDAVVCPCFDANTIANLPIIHSCNENFECIGINNDPIDLNPCSFDFFGDDGGVLVKKTEPPACSCLNPGEGMICLNLEQLNLTTSQLLECINLINATPDCQQ